MKKPTHHRYPQTLIDLQHLEGGSYGSLRLIARDRETLEIQLGSDFVRITPDDASSLAQALETFACAPPRMVVEVEEEEETEVELEGPPGPRLARPPRTVRRRAHG